jgi:FkbM family methyltransferase
MKHFDITYHGETVTLADLPEYRKFYGKLQSGKWEPRTFRTLNEQLTPDVTYIDIGGWIGVTPFWASRRAKRIIVVEPDPKCRRILEGLLPLYHNVTLTSSALTSESCLKLNAIDGFGSSETTALAIGDGTCSVTVSGCSMAELLHQAGPGPVFVKIDIEGYEYRIADELKRLDCSKVKGVQLALHPGLYERALAGPLLFRRVRTLLATWRLARLFGKLKRMPAAGKYSSLAAYLAKGVAFVASPRGADLLFLNKTGQLQSASGDHTLAPRGVSPVQTGQNEGEGAAP